MSRRTFVLQVYSDGLSTLENLGTRERVALTDLKALNAQVERWLAVADAKDTVDPPPSEPDQHRRAPRPPAGS